MPPRVAAFGRASATLATLRRPHLAPRSCTLQNRTFSLFPWRRSQTQAPLPVYFAKLPSQARPGAWRRRLGRAAFTTLAFYACWQIFATVVFEPLLDWADHEWDSLSDKEKQEMEQLAEDDEPILFLPFPFTTKEVQQPPYKGSDPEWAVFVAVNKDQQMQKNIKLGLAEAIRRGVEKNPAYISLLGGKDIKLKKLWLDIIYPPRPPAKHYVAGIIIDDDGIFWGDRPIDSLAASHLNMAIYPKTVALTLWTFVNSLFKQTASDVAKALGLSTTSTPEPTWQSVALNRMREQRALGGQGKQPSNGLETQPENFPIHTAGAEMVGTPFNGETQMDPRVQAALQAASRTFSKNWQPAKPPPSRGCIRVDGLVELQGKAAIMAVYVFGWYNPKLRRWEKIDTSLKHLISVKQRPSDG